jgi:hypothetical protein
MSTEPTVMTDVVGAFVAKNMKAGKLPDGRRFRFAGQPATI